MSLRFGLPTIENWASLPGSRVLVRVDFNTPLESVDGEVRVADDFRIRCAVPLFRELMDRGAHVVAATHVGRPEGHFVEKYSVAPMRRRLEELCPGVELMENLRFDPGEESNDPEFGRMLVKGFDYYINEAFGVSHRAHASVVAPPAYLPSAAGPNLLTEVTTLLGVFDEPVRPFVAVVGGAKVADKLAIIARLVDKADRVIIGGAMAYTFWRAQGCSIGDSLVDDSRVAECRQLLESGRIVLPVDSVGLASGRPFGPDGGPDEPRTFEGAVPEGWVGLDIGPRSAALFDEVVRGAGTVLWNGPMGVFEDPRFDAGTRAMAEAVAHGPGRSIIGGGDSGAAVTKFGLSDQIGYISSGGGASLELLERGDLPGLRALRDCPWNSES